MNLLKGIDYGLATVFGIPAGIYISSYVQFKEWRWAVKAINWLFQDPNHCAVSAIHNAEDISYYYK
jgi:hypothetical protein